MQPRSANLCDKCAKIDFSFFDACDERHITPLGIALGKDHSTDCAFCGLVEHCIHRSGELELSSRSSVLGIYEGRELQLFQGNTRLKYSIRRCDHISFHENLNSPVHVSHSFNSLELRRWLESCDLHNCIPDRISESFTFPKDFRLIDVQESRIVYPHTFVRYCALSYVWGPASHVCLNSNSKRQLEIHGGIDHMEDLPQTIKDSMALCRDIGCRYLWVDSLCILQDSKEDRHSQIHAMADIYSRANVTIIAASGENAHSGLRPYGAFGRQAAVQSLVVHISGLGKFVSSLSPQISAEDIATSVWASRGWTLQEQALSRRVLFFTGQYTFFRCERSLWNEDFGLGFANCFSMIEKWDLPVAPFYRRKSIDGHIYSSTFKHILGGYLRRQQNLRYSQDILNAITGVLLRLKDDIGEHVWGLPSKRFSAALQWKTEGVCSSAQRSGFPSWSWAGWYHEISVTMPNGHQFYDVYQDSDIKETNQSAITCWVGDEDYKLRSMEHPSLDAISRGKPDTESAPISQQDVTALNLFQPPPHTVLEFYHNWRSQSISPISQHLFIWASCANIYVDSTCHRLVGPDLGTFALRAQAKGKIIGSIELSPTWRKIAGDSMEFFVTTVGVYSSKANSPSEVRVRVMLIEPLHKEKGFVPPICRRIQVANDIRLGHWESCLPRNRLIAIV